MRWPMTLSSSSAQPSASWLLESRLGQCLIGVAAVFFAFALLYVGKHPVLLLAIGLLPIAAICALNRPFWMVLAFVIFSFFRLHEVFPQLYNLRIPQLLAMASLASLGYNIITGRMQVFITRELIAFLIFFALVTIGLFFATNRGAAMGNWTGVYSKIAIMTFAIAWLSTSERAFALTGRMMVLSGIMVSLVALKNKAEGIGLVEGTRVTIGRDIGSMLGDPNDLSLVLLFAASFGLSLVMTPRIPLLTRIFGLLGFALCVAAVIATQSRGGLLGILAVTGVFAWRKVKNKALLIAVGTMALSVLFIAAGISDRASGGAHEEGIDASAMGRIYAWEAAFYMALSHPFTGVGLDNFLSNYWSYSQHWDGQNHAVHSTWFGVMAETGFLGLGAFLTMIGLTVRTALTSVSQLKPGDDDSAKTYSREAYAMAQAILSGLAGFCISGSFLTMGFTWPIYIQLALCVGVATYVRKQQVANLESLSQNADTPLNQKIKPLN